MSASLIPDTRTLPFSWGRVALSTSSWDGSEGTTAHGRYMTCAGNTRFRFGVEECSSPELAAPITSPARPAVRRLLGAGHGRGDPVLAGEPDGRCGRRPPDRCAPPVHGRAGRGRGAVPR